MSLRQTTGFVQSLLQVVGLDWAVWDLSKLRRSQRRPNVAIHYSGEKGLPNLLINITVIEAESAGKWDVRKHGGPKRRI